MQDIINQYIGGLKLVREQSYKNLTVFALLSDYAANLDYLTLDEALDLQIRQIFQRKAHHGIQTPRPQSRPGEILAEKFGNLPLRPGRYLERSIDAGI